MPVNDPDLAAMLALNQAHRTETSSLDAAALAELVAMSFCTLTTAGTDGFIIAMDQDAHYRSPNFQWFRARYERFVYVDRIIVADAARGRGVGRGLYDMLLARAAAAGHRMACCEVNLVPPNPGSASFHAALDFSEVGRGSPAAGKVVAYLARIVRPD